MLQGWTVYSRDYQKMIKSETVSCHHIRYHWGDDIVHARNKKICGQDFMEQQDDEETTNSIENKRALKMVEHSKCVVEDHYQLEVPLREENALLDNSSVCINDVSLQWLDLLQPLFHILAGVNKV